MSRFKFVAATVLTLSGLLAPIVSHADGWTVGPYVITSKSLTPNPSPDPNHVAATYDPSHPNVYATVTVDGASATADVTYKATATYTGRTVSGTRYAHEKGGISGIATKYANGYPQATSTVTPQKGDTLTAAISYKSKPSTYNDQSGDWTLIVGGDSDSEVSATIELLANGIDDEGFATATGSISFILPTPPVGPDPTASSRSYAKKLWNAKSAVYLACSMYRNNLTQNHNYPY